MKKRYLLLTLAGVVLLGACQNKSDSTKEKQTEKTTQTSTQKITEETSQTTTEKTTEQTTSSTTTSSSEESTEKVVKLDLEAIKNGDYSTLAGRWVTADGSSSFEIDAAGTFNGKWMPKMDTARIENGILRASLTDGTYGMAVYIAAEGAGFPQGVDGLADASDNTKERVWTGQQPIYSDPNKFYYRETTSSETSTATAQAQKSQTPDEAIQRRDTGVWLDESYSSVEHANAVLGVKDRIVSGGSYGRTEGIPYHAVLSPDEVVFVYQNGVILSSDGAILYEP